jgi:hypothetical protein
MIIQPQALTKAMSSPGVGFRPASVLALALLEGAQLSTKLVFDHATDVFFADPLIGPKLHGAAHGARDLMVDSFGGGDHCIGLQFGDWWVLGAKIGDWTLIAMCPARALLDPVETWLVRLGRALCAGEKTAGQG